jgi:hypothetical protein
MGDMNWLSLEDAERLFFASADEVLKLVSDGEIESKEVNESGKTYLRVMEIHLDRNFHRRTPNSRIKSAKKEIAIGAAGGVAAASIYDVANAVLAIFDTPSEPKDRERDDPPLKLPVPELGFPRSYLLEQSILSIASKTRMPVRQQLLRAMQRSFDYREIGKTDLAMDIFANSLFSETALIENRVLIDDGYAEDFLKSFGWERFPIGLPKRYEHIRFVGLKYHGREYYTYAEWLASLNLLHSRDVRERLDYHSILVEHYLANSR